MSFFFKEHKLPIHKQTLRDILNRVISPRLKKCGLVWNADYLWFDQPHDSIRFVFHYTLLKGETGTFTWGVCPDFIPTITTSNKLQFHRTDKSVKPLLFDWPNEYTNSFSGGNLKNGVTTHWGKKEAERSIKDLMDRYENQIFNWFKTASSLDGLIQIAERQIETGKSYNIHNPNPKLVLAFLYGKTSQKDKAMQMIELLNTDQLLKEDLIMRIENQA